MAEFSKKQFQDFWPGGYYENFGWGVGIEKVIEVSMAPFYDKEKVALELGPGGGVFTERLIGKFKHLYALDVIKMPEKLKDWKDFTFVELPDQDFTCNGIKKNSIDFCFTYGMFCHLSNDALKEYIKNVYTVLKKGGDFVFMISNHQNMIKLYPSDSQYTELGVGLSSGHFLQDDRTIEIVVDKRWTIVSRNLTPDHRDIMVHVRK
jgi:SAM-dependent methyltransferase